MKTATLKPPDQVEREYTRLLQWYVRQIVATTRRTLIPRLPAILSQYKEGLRGDGWVEDLIIALAAILDKAVFDGRVIESRLPGIFALLAKSNDRSLIFAVKAATGETLPPSASMKSLLGIDVYRSEPWLAKMQSAWVHQNVSLVKTIGEDYHNQLETVVRKGVFNGWSVKQLSDEIQKKFDVTKFRATLIAQDQILGAAARLTQIRAEAIGVTDYVWKTVNDSRVRPTHVHFNGKQYSWAKPGPEGHPGEPIRCRCRASLIFKDV